MCLPNEAGLTCLSEQPVPALEHKCAPSPLGRHAPSDPSLLLKSCAGHCWGVHEEGEDGEGGTQADPRFPVAQGGPGLGRSIICCFSGYAKFETSGAPGLREVGAAELSRGGIWGDEGEVTAQHWGPQRYRWEGSQENRSRSPR